MSILSKFIKKIVTEVEQKTEKFIENIGQEQKPSPGDTTGCANTGGQLYGTHNPPPVYDVPESGFSWGPEMPAEENQYNFPGTYVEYFEKVFTENFPEYSIRHEPAYSGRATNFYFTKNDDLALVVELLSEKSHVVVLRKRCRANGTPYLRFYYDHDSWWNTKAYVLDRTERALGIKA